MFAAYAEKSRNTGDGDSENNDGKNESRSVTDWLSNSSFTINSEAISNIQGVVANNKDASIPPRPSNENAAVQITLDSSSPNSPQTPGTSDVEDDSDVKVLSPRQSSCSTSASDLYSSSTPDENDETTARASKNVRGKGKTQREKCLSHKKSRSPSQRISSRDRESSRHKKNRFSRRKTRSRSTSRSQSSSASRGRSRSTSRSRRKKKSHSRKDSKERARKFRHENRKKRRSSSEESSEHRDRKKHSSSLRSTGISREQDDLYYEQKYGASGNLMVATLARPAIPWYRPSKRVLGAPKMYSLPSVKRTLKNRYFNRILKEMEAEVIASKEKGENDKIKQGQIQGNVNDVEEEISKTTAKFNKDLADDPQNINLWMEYVQFQDVVHQFERVYRRGGGASGARVTAERKLSILDKALKANPMHEELLKERCQLAESVLPSDKLTTQLKTWIGSNSGNLVLWEALIMATQGSLSTCKVPAVKSLYQEALTNIHNLRKGNIEPPKVVESKLIDVVLHLGLFFRQAGLLELMWSLISVYLEFNLAKLDPTKFHITNTVADNALTELEEAILASKLPLPTLWSRVETLRAGTHWVPLAADADSEDPQRLVFPEDINDLIHPINCPHLSFRLVSVTLTLLKVPLLPWRECAAKAAGLHPLPWLLDGPEPLYASLLRLGTLEFKETSSLLLDASQLTSGPQYMIARPGQDEYIDFLTQVFAACSDCLPPSQKTYLLVWWLRFYRWLIQLDRLGHCKLPPGRKKKIRATAKDLLKKDSNRSNFLLFKEFALLELENGSDDSAKKVLQGTIAALPLSKPVPVSKDKAFICSLYRTLVEMLLSHNSPSDARGHSSTVPGNTTNAEARNMALSLLVSLGKGTPLKNDKPSSTDIAAAISKFSHITKVALDNPSEEELDPFIAPDICHLAPTFLVEWASCHGWLLFLSNSIWKAAAMFESLLSELRVASPDTDSSDGSSSAIHPNFIKLQREALFEIYVSLLRHHCFESHGSYGVLRDILLKGLKEFPGNLTFAAALADLETNDSGTGLPLWRLSKMFYEFHSAPAYVLFVFVMKHRLKQQESAAQRAHALLSNEGSSVMRDPNIRNRMSTLLKKLTKHPSMRRCPMLWRLRLQFVAAISSNDADCSSTFYLALEDCPWVKALYMDIVQVLPTQLAQVQDLLIEKELRLHVTPEELEILRIDT